MQMDHTNPMFGFVTSSPLFESLDKEEQKLVAKRMRHMTISQGEKLFSEGDEGNFLAFLVMGELVVVKADKDGDEHELAKIERGRVIGEMSIIDEVPRSATIKATTRSTVLTFSKYDFDSVVDTHPKIGVKILKGIARLISRNVRDTANRLVDKL